MATPLFGTTAPSLSDTRKIVLIRTLEAMLATLQAYGGTVSNPILGTDNPTLNDPELFILIKLCEAANAIAATVSGGSSGSYAAGGNFSGHGSPQGVITANKGATYVDLDEPGSVWTKVTDGVNTGWGH